MADNLQGAEGGSTADRPWGVEDTSLLCDVTSLSASADGRVAFVRHFDDTERDRRRREVWIVDDNGPSRLTTGPADGHPVWLDDGRLALVRRRDDGSHLVVLDAADGASDATELATFALGVRDLVPGGSGGRLAVIALDHAAPSGSSNEPSDAPFAIPEVLHQADGVGPLTGLWSCLFVVDGAGGTTRVRGADGHVMAAVWSPDGRRLAWSAAVHERRGLDRRTDVFVSDGDGEPTRYPAPDGWAMTPLVWDRAERILVALTPHRPTGHTRLAVLDPVAGRLQWLFDDLDANIRTGEPGYPGAQPFVRDDQVVFAVRAGGTVQLWHGRMDGTGSAEALWAPAGTLCHGACDAGDGTLVVATRAPGRPTEVERVTPETGTVASVTSLHDDLVARRTWIGAEALSWTIGEVEVHGWLRGRRAHGPQPMLVDLHGGPHNAWSPAFDPDHLYQQELAAAGWLVLTLNPRGSDGGSNDFFRGLVDRGWGFADEHDVLQPVADLVDRGLARPNAVALAGYSYGGYLGAWLIARHPDRFAAAVLGGLVANRVSHAGGSDYGAASVPAETGRGFVEALDGLWQSSPLAHLDQRPRPPTLLLHGLEDTRCPFDQAEQFHVALRDLGGTVELVAYPGASHLFVLDGRPSHRVDWQRRLVAWLQAHAGDGAIPRSGD